MGEVLWFSVICGVVALIYAIFTSRSVLNSDPGSKKMQEISNAIKEGAYAYLNRQYRTILLVGIVIFIVIVFFKLNLYTHAPFADLHYPMRNSSWQIAHGSEKMT